MTFVARGAPDRTQGIKQYGIAQRGQFDWPDGDRVAVRRRSLSKTLPPEAARAAGREHPQHGSRAPSTHPYPAPGEAIAMISPSGVFPY